MKKSMKGNSKASTKKNTSLKIGPTLEMASMNSISKATWINKKTTQCKARKKINTRALSTLVEPQKNMNPYLLI